jgi:HK97 family phage major capsid protein
MRVVVTSNITVGTALVGAFAEGATLFRKGGLRVEATNSHGTYFTSNVTAIRAEMREALCVFRPSAFVAVTGLAT